MMKISKILIAGVLSFSATLANASTILFPTDGDVNFYVAPGFTDTGLQLAIFNDSEAVASGAQITTSTGLLDIIMTNTGFIEGGIINFDGNSGPGTNYQANNGVSIFDLDAINDNFIVGMSFDNGTTWFADSSALLGPANSASLTFTNGVSTFVVDVQAVPVPAAVWLFGSGLIGLVGVARRRA